MSMINFGGGVADADFSRNVMLGTEVSGQSKVSRN